MIIDDICLGGRTFINIRKEIPNKEVYLAVSHGVFDSGGYGDPIPALTEAFTHIFTTNSRKNEEDYNNDKITAFKLF